MGSRARARARTHTHTGGASSSLRTWAMAWPRRTRPTSSGERGGRGVGGGGGEEREGGRDGRAQGRRGRAGGRRGRAGGMGGHEGGDGRRLAGGMKDVGPAAPSQPPPPPASPRRTGGRPNAHAAIHPRPRHGADTHPHVPARPGRRDACLARDPVPPRPVSPRPVSPRPVSPRPVPPRPVSPRPVSPRPSLPGRLSPAVSPRPRRKRTRPLLCPHPNCRVPTHGDVAPSRHRSSFFF